MALRTDTATRIEITTSEAPASTLYAEAIAPARGIIIGVMLSACMWAGGIWAAVRLL